MEWVSDHWMLTITLSLIASATYIIPRVTAAYYASRSIHTISNTTRY